MLRKAEENKDIQPEVTKSGLHLERLKSLEKAEGTVGWHYESRNTGNSWPPRHEENDKENIFNIN